MLMSIRISGIIQCPIYVRTPGRVRTFSRMILPTKCRLSRLCGAPSRFRESHLRQGHAFHRNPVLARNLLDKQPWIVSHKS